MEICAIWGFSILFNHIVHLTAARVRFLPNAKGYSWDGDP
jgi:hypothetical protein